MQLESKTEVNSEQMTISAPILSGEMQTSGVKQ